jgi:hypothetical protein
MSDIKTKDLKPKSVKVLDKATAWTERIKDPIVYANEKSKDAVSGDGNIVDYGSDKIKYVSNRAKDESIYAAKKGVTKTKNVAIKKYQRKKLAKATKTDKVGKTIKTSKNTVKKAEKAAKEAAKLSKRMAEQGKKLAIKATKATVKGTKAAIKATISAIKAIIAGKVQYVFLCKNNSLGDKYDSVIKNYAKAYMGKEPIIISDFLILRDIVMNKYISNCGDIKKI